MEAAIAAKTSELTTQAEAAIAARQIRTQRTSSLQPSRSGKSTLRDELQKHDRAQGGRTQGAGPRRRSPKKMRR
jgi:hypothetical protein